MLIPGLAGTSRQVSPGGCNRRHFLISRPILVASAGGQDTSPGLAVVSRRFRRRVRGPPVLPERQKSAKIHAGSGFIWRISGKVDDMSWKQSLRYVATLLIAVLSCYCVGLGPSLAQNGCANLGGLRSGTGTQPVSLRFDNDTNGVVNIFWINQSGAQILYSRLGSHQQYSVNTFQTHAWLVTDSTGACLEAFAAITSQVVPINLVCNGGDVTFTDATCGTCNGTCYIVVCYGSAGQLGIGHASLQKGQSANFKSPPGSTYDAICNSPAPNKCPATLCVNGP
jgi:VHL beta domain